MIHCLEEATTFESTSQLQICYSLYDQVERFLPILGRRILLLAVRSSVLLVLIEEGLLGTERTLQHALIDEATNDDG